MSHTFTETRLILDTTPVRKSTTTIITHRRSRK